MCIYIYTYTYTYNIYIYTYTYNNFPLEVSFDIFPLFIYLFILFPGGWGEGNFSILLAMIHMQKNVFITKKIFRFICWGSENSKLSKFLTFKVLKYL